MNKIALGFQILAYRLTHYRLRDTLWWALDHLVRRISGAPIRALSQIRPYLHVGGQYRARGWPKLVARGVTAVVNMRVEFDDRQAGLAPEQYLYLPTIDDTAPSLEQLQQGVAFIHRQIDAGGSVYVHCGAGVGRAATMAAAFFVSAGMAPAQAWQTIRAVRPFIKPTAEQLAQIERFAGTSRASFPAEAAGLPDR